MEQAVRHGQGQTNPAEGRFLRQQQCSHFLRDQKTQLVDSTSLGWGPRGWRTWGTFQQFLWDFATPSVSARSRSPGSLKGPGDTSAPTRGFSVFTGRGPFSAALPSRCRIRQRRWRMLDDATRGRPPPASGAKGSLALRLVQSRRMKEGWSQIRAPNQ